MAGALLSLTSGAKLGYRIAVRSGQFELGLNGTVIARVDRPLRDDSPWHVTGLAPGFHRLDLTARNIGAERYDAECRLWVGEPDVPTWTTVYTYRHSGHAAETATGDCVRLHVRDSGQEGMGRSGEHPRLAAVARWVESHLTEPISVADAAHVMGMEAKYFSAFFRATAGIRFGEWVRTLRVERAMRLMRADSPARRSLTRLAFEAGFGDVRSFERAFKRAVGLTPRAYRTSLPPESRQLPHWPES